MASEILSIPEESLAEFIFVIRKGLSATFHSPRVSQETRDALNNWCDEEEDYMDSWGDE